MRVPQGGKMSYNLERIDAQNDEFFREHEEAVSHGRLTVSDIIGFELKSAALVSLPKCGVVCSSNLSQTETSIFSLLPLYESILCPIVPDGYYGERKVNAKNFFKFYGIAFNQFIELVRRKRVIPYFLSAYNSYERSLILPFMEPGIPRISVQSLQLIKLMGICNIVSCDECKKTFSRVEADIKQFLDMRRFETKEKHDCRGCLLTAYLNGITKDRILGLSNPDIALCDVPQIIISKNLNAVYQSNCSIGKESLAVFSKESPRGHPEAVETILDGLEIKYSNEIDLNSYLDLLDSKTTKAIRQAIKKIMEDPFASKSYDRLNARICDYNNQVEEIANNRIAKFFNAVSEIAVFGVSKTIEKETDGAFKLGKSNRTSVSQSIASALLDTHSKITHKDWSIAQIYKTKCKIQAMKK